MQARVQSINLFAATIAHGLRRAGRLSLRRAARVCFGSRRYLIKSIGQLH